VLNRDLESSRAFSWASGETMMVSPAPRALSFEPENSAFRAMSVAPSVERDTKRPRTLAAGPCVNGFDLSGRLFLSWLPERNPLRTHILAVLWQEILSKGCLCASLLGSTC